MAQDINIAYRLGEHGFESAPVVNGKIDPTSWNLVDFDLLVDDHATDLRGMMDAMIYATRIE